MRKFASRKFLVTVFVMVFLAAGAITGQLPWSGSVDWAWKMALAYLGAEGGTDAVNVWRNGKRHDHWEGERKTSGGTPKP